MLQKKCVVCLQEGMAGRLENRENRECFFSATLIGYSTLISIRFSCALCILRVRTSESTQCLMERAVRDLNSVNWNISFCTSWNMKNFTITFKVGQSLNDGIDN